MGLLNRDNGTPFIGYGVVNSRIWSGHRFKALISWLVVFVASMLALFTLNITLSRMYEDYYSSKQSLTKRVTELRIEVTDLKIKHEKDAEELRDLLFTYQVMELTKRVTDGAATLEEKAWLEFLKKKKEEYKNTKSSVNH